MRTRALLVSLALVVATILGCQGMGAKSVQEQAMSMLSEGVKQQIGTYLQDVDDVTALLKDVNSFKRALETRPKLSPYVTKLQDGYTSLRGLDPETLKNVRTAFGPQLTDAASGFRDQLNRVADQSGVGSLIKPILDKVSLFQ